MKNRIELAKHFAELGYKKGVEVGVCDGVYSQKLLDNIPGLQLYGVDPYLPYKGFSKERQDEKITAACERLNKYPNYILIKAPSVEAAKLIPDGSQDFVFIDGNHDYEDVKEDMETWYPKVRKGGILSGHDYYPKCARGAVIKAVDEVVASLGVKLELTEWDMEAYVDDRQPDWFFTV